MAFVNHPRIAFETVEERGYQTRMVEQCVRANTLLILPTGLGKTVIAVRVAAEFLSEGKVLLMAPTKPLVEQHFSEFARLLTGTRVSMINGLMKDSKRAGIVEESDVVVSTPQTVQNDLEAGRYDLSRFALVIYDEAHRGRGDYAYVKVAPHVPRRARSVGMTASPGSSIDRIEEVCIALNLRRIDMRTETDPDVAPYVHDTYINRIEVDLPSDIQDISALLKVMLDHFYSELCGLGAAYRNIAPSKSYLLRVGGELQERVGAGERSGAVFRALTVDKTCIQLSEAISKVESEGTTVLRRYLDRLEAEAAQDKGGRAAQAIVRRPEYAGVRTILSKTNVEHPKVSRVMTLVSRTLSANPSSKVLVFAQFRDTCEMLVEKISGIEGARVGMLIGQSKGGLRQKEQVSLLERFRSGEFNVLVSTSVGEEGLDVSNTDAVVFYEPVPSEIRTIQRRGRTGRKSDGDVYLLIARGTVDEAFDRSSIRKEQSMRENLERLSERLSRGMTLGDGGQRSLDSFRPPGIRCSAGGPARRPPAEPRWDHADGVPYPSLSRSRSRGRCSCTGPRGAVQPLPLNLCRVSLPQPLSMTTWGIGMPWRPSTRHGMNCVSCFPVAEGWHRATPSARDSIGVLSLRIPKYTDCFCVLVFGCSTTALLTRRLTR